MEFGKKRIILDDKLLNQKVLNKNKKLEESNKKLSLTISDKKKELKSLDAEVKSAKKDKDSILDSIRKDKEFSSLLKEKINNLSQDKLVANNLVKEAKSEAKTFNRMTSDAERKLTAAENRIETLEKKSEEFIGIHKKISKAKVESKNIEIENSAAKRAIKDMNSEWQSDCDSRENEFESLKQGLSKDLGVLNKNVSDLNDDKSMLEHEIVILKSQSNQQKKKFNEELGKNMEALSALHLDSMVKVKQEVDKLKYLISETEKKSKELEVNDSKLNEIKEKHSKAQAKFNQWRISAVDEIARMKNKGKLENIDKAGLSDVLNQ